MHHVVAVAYCVRMADAGEPQGAPRQERRKAATRKKILDAADALFDDRGYAETSIEDISTAADVAVRTIYLHFSSKAGILLAYFDEWLDAFIGEIVRRPLDEPVADSVAAALRAMGESGWTDRVEAEDRSVHPLVEQLDTGSPDIAGHVMQRWMGVIGRLAEDAMARGGAESVLDAHARAIGIFAAWLAAISAARSKQRGLDLPPGATGNSVGLDILRRLTGGGL